MPLRLHTINIGEPDVAGLPLTLPLAYRDGYASGRVANPDLADLYIRHTLEGDPLADAALAELADFDQRTAHRLIDAGMERRDAEFAAAPPALRHFFEALSNRRSGTSRRRCCRGCGLIIRTRICSLRPMWPGCWSAGSLR